MRQLLRFFFFLVRAQIEPYVACTEPVHARHFCRRGMKYLSDIVGILVPLRIDVMTYTF